MIVLHESANKGNFKALLFFFAESVVTVCELIISPHFTLIMKIIKAAQMAGVETLTLKLERKVF